MPIIKCSTCGLEIKRPPSAIKKYNFCNHKCYSAQKAKMWNGNNNIRWKGGTIIKQCVVCGNNFNTKRYGEKRDSKIKYCSIKCSAIDRGKHQRKENHPMWKGGKEIRTATPIRRTGRYKQWVKSVFQRDNYTCQECGKKGGNLEAHHLKRLSEIVEEYINKNYKLNIDDDVFYDINNGKTLCLKCHRKTFKIENRVNCWNAKDKSKPISNQAII